MLGRIGTQLQVRGGSTPAATRRQVRQFRSRLAANFDIDPRIASCSPQVGGVMQNRIGTWGLVAALVLGGCTARELSWMVPRASVGFALRTHEGHVAGAGFVTLVAPLERAARMRPARATAGRASMRLLGPPPACRVPAACRWEGRARTGTVADLAEELESEEVMP
jgi:hypothetical protein